MTVTRSSACSWIGDLWLLIWKNWILKKRRVWTLLFELILPVLFVLLFSYLKTLQPNVAVPAGWSDGQANVTGCDSDCQATSDPLFSTFDFTIRKGVSELSSSTVPVTLSIPRYYASETSMTGYLAGLPVQSIFNSPEVLRNQQALLQCQSLLTSGDLQNVPANCPVVPYQLGVIVEDESYFKYFSETLARWYPRVRLFGLGPTFGISSPGWTDVVKFFNSEDAFNKYVRDPDYGKTLDFKKIIGALHIKQHPPAGQQGSWDYAVRLNATLNQGNVLYSSVNTKRNAVNRAQRGVSSQEMLQYTIGGFSTLSTLMTRFMTCNPDPSTYTCKNLEAVTDATSPTFQSKAVGYLKRDVMLNYAFGIINVLGSSAGINLQGLGVDSLPQSELSKVLLPLSIAPQPTTESAVFAFPVAAYTNAPFYTLVAQVFPLAFIAAYLFGLSRILVSFISEKELKQREGLQLIGVSSTSVIGSWYLTYITMNLISSVLMVLASAFSLFSNTSWFMLFLFYFFFGLDVIAFSFLASTFFSKARVGSLAGLCVFFMFYFIYYGVSGTEVTTGTKVLSSLLAPCAMALGVNTMATFESSSVGISPSNASDLIDGYSFSISIGMMLFDFIIYTIIGIYLEQVLPREWGVRKKWYFCLTPRFWCGAKKASSGAKLADGTAGDSIEGSSGTSNIEGVSLDLKQQEADGRAVKLFGLKKEFSTPGGTKTAVKGLNLVMYEGQITCLLGHNGAGKTTTINMLTGMLEPSAGDAIINGYHITDGMPQIRRSLGLCPQHDVLYNDMTVEEHLVLYGSLKGLKGSALKEEVAKKVMEVGLTEKKQARIMELSGGMKRKLSVAVALIGDSKVVFLDEPTSGMDPYSRRSTWDLIQNNKDGRVIVLTTHFMDEADLLGDRIAIMAEGDLRCCGSSLFLKNRYGVGYNLTLIKNDGCNANEVSQVIKNYVPEAELLSNVGAEIIFQLPISSSAAFPTMFAQLDRSLDALKLAQYGISVTTLEEVFIKVAEVGDVEGPAALLKQPSLRTSSFEQHEAPAGAKVPSSYKLGQDAPPASAITHFQAIFKKRFRYAKRDKKAVVCSVILPLVMLAVGLIQLRVNVLTKDYPSFALDATTLTTFKSERDSNLPSMTACYPSDPLCTSTLSKQVVTPVADSAFAPFSAQPEAFGLAYPDVNASSAQGLTLKFTKSVYAFGYDSPRRSEFTQYGAYFVSANQATKELGYTVGVNTTSAHATGIYKSFMNQAVYRQVTGSNHDVKVSLHPLPLTDSVKALFGSFISFTAITYILLAMAFIPSTIAAFIVREREVAHNAKHQQMVSGVSLPAFWLGNFAWDFLVYLVTFAVSLILIVAFQVDTFTGKACEKNCIDNVFLGVALLLLFYGLAVIPFTYTIQYLFKSHGSAQYITYFINFLLGLVLMIVAFVMKTLESTQDAIKILVFFFRIFPPFCLGEGLLNITLRDLVFSFESREGNQSVFDLELTGWCIIYLIIETILFTLIAIAIDTFLSNPWIKAKYSKDPQVVDTPFEEDEDVIAEQARIKSGAADGELVTLQGLRKVYTGLKKGSTKVALKDLWFSIPAGQCFGFLGINGAGKTTTMKILTGEILPTSGTGSIGGRDILNEQLAVRRLIGYCPQFDALLDLLTVREHLELFATIKGVPKSRINEVVMEKMTQMDLLQYENKLAHSLSGGNKRKLSVAIAMVGSPPVLFLDEPSTGMDPVARRFMWEVIAKVSTETQESSVILTTHSMEECEALCTNVGIMVGGRLRCLGSVQHLKNRYGRGLMMEIRLSPITQEEAEAFAARKWSSFSTHGNRLTLDDLERACIAFGKPERHAVIGPDSDDGWVVFSAIKRDGYISAAAFAGWWLSQDRYEGLKTFMASTFNNAELLERHDALTRWRVSEYTKSLARIFAAVEQSKKELNISEYSVSQTSLEQVFNQFAAQQEEETGHIRGMAGAGGAQNHATDVEVTVVDDVGVSTESTGFSEVKSPRRKVL